MSVYLSVFLLIVSGVCAAAAVSDFRRLLIPNLYSVVVIVLFVPAYLLVPEAFGHWTHHLMAAGIMLVIGFFLFVVKLFGGGDAKFATAVALWLGVKGLLPFVLYMTICGGVLGVAGLYIAKKKPFKTIGKGGWIDQLQQGRNAIPYGIAIAFGFWAAAARLWMF